ncbi:MAG TPA: hypothetical protein VF940_14730 [Streptosporangiaceae bacterium]
MGVGKSRVGRIETGKWQVVEPVIGEAYRTGWSAWRGPAAAQAQPPGMRVQRRGRHASRSEYVRRRLAQDAATPGSRVSAEDLARFAETFGDLADPDVMSRAWQ